jgi:hypothetical protein
MRTVLSFDEPVNTPLFDPLIAFFGWWMNETKGGLFPSVHDGVTKVGCEFTGLVLYRQPPFQVELWIVAPNTEIPEHAHPNIDSFLVHVTGDLTVFVGEEMVLGPVQTVARPDGVCKSNGNWIRIRPGQQHAGRTGPLGAAFLNVQLWLDGKPRSADSDWKGDALNEEHKKKLSAAYSGKVKQCVNSLRENSGSATNEPGNTLRRVKDTVASQVASTRLYSTDGGLVRSSADAARSGEVSTVDA